MGTDCNKGKRNPVVSIIMAVYNAESTLSRMLDSIINQTFQNWQLIAVNDGSTDASRRILESYASLDQRITIINKTNGGVASARQTGIEQSSGTYLIHADSDDYIEPDMINSMYTLALQENADMVIADYYVEHPSGKQIYVSQKPKSLDRYDVLYGMYNNELFGGLWHKLINKNAYYNAKAHFIKGIDYCEDLLLLTQILSSVELKIAYINRAFYHYVLQSNSLTQKVSLRGFQSLAKFNTVFPKYLPHENRFISIINQSKLKLFIVGFINNLYDLKEIKPEFNKVRKLAYQSKSIRWLVGYICIDLGLIAVARKLIRY